MAAGKIPPAVSDFTVLPLRMPVLPSYPHAATHYLYLRPNAPRVPTDSTPRELFAVNVPVDATEIHFRGLFSEQLGRVRVESVEFEGVRVGKGIKAPLVQKGKKRKRDSSAAGNDNGPEVGVLPDVWERELHPSGSTAVVRFVDRASAETALREARKAAKMGKSVAWEEAGSRARDDVPPLGSARYVAHHRLRYPDAAVLQASVDDFMAAFTAQESERAALLARQRSVPDEDGFITVTRGGRTAPAREEAARAKDETLKKREKARIKDDFYRFQVREKKKEHAKDLVREFEEDRKKVEEMRRRRGKLRPE